MSVSIERSDRTLLRGLTRRLRAAQARAGCNFSCEPGCSDCCSGPFSITALDALRLQRGLRVLRKRRPARARALDARAVGYLEELAAVLPGAVARGALAPGDEERLAHKLNRWPCPALDPMRRTCDLYPYRPISCRTFGQPVRIEDKRLPFCEKCAAGLSAEQIERGRAEVDPTDREGELLFALAPEGGIESETLVALALRDPQLLEVRTDESEGY